MGEEKITIDYKEWQEIMRDYDYQTKQANEYLLEAQKYACELAKVQKENQQLKEKLEVSKHNQKQASDSCRQHRLASKNHIRRLERREKQIARLKEKLEASEKARKEAIEYINKNLTISSILDGKKEYCLNNYNFDYRKLLNILDIDKGEIINGKY